MQKQLCSVEDYERFIGPAVVDRILQKTKAFQGFRLANFSSTGYGGGVAELLTGMTLLMNSAGIKAEWRVMQGRPDFLTSPRKSTMRCKEPTSISPKSRPAFLKRLILKTQSEPGLNTILL
jgi:hypothetical protein